MVSQDGFVRIDFYVSNESRAQQTALICINTIARMGCDWCQRRLMSVYNVCIKYNIYSVYIYCVCYAFTSQSKIWDWNDHFRVNAPKKNNGCFAVQLCHFSFTRFSRLSTYNVVSTRSVPVMSLRNRVIDSHYGGGKLVILPLIVYKFPQFPLHWSPLYLGCWEHPWVDEIGKWQLKTLCSEPWWPVLTEPINPSTTPFTIQHMWVYNHDHKQPHHERCCFWESTQSCISDWSIMWFYHVLSKYDAHQRVEMNVTILFWMCFFPVPIYLIFGYIWWNAYTESIWKDCFQVRAFTQKNMHPFEGDNVGKHSCPAGEELANPCHSRDFGSQTVSPGHYPLVI